MGDNRTEDVRVYFVVRDDGGKLTIKHVAGRAAGKTVFVTKCQTTGFRARIPFEDCHFTMADAVMAYQKKFVTPLEVQAQRARQEFDNFALHCANHLKVQLEGDKARL